VKEFTGYIQGPSKKTLCKLGCTMDQYAWKLELQNRLQKEAGDQLDVVCNKAVCYTVYVLYDFLNTGLQIQTFIINKILLNRKLVFQENTGSVQYYAVSLFSHNVGWIMIFHMIIWRNNILFCVIWKICWTEEAYANHT